MTAIATSASSPGRIKGLCSPGLDLADMSAKSELISVSDGFSDDPPGYLLVGIIILHLGEFTQQDPQPVLNVFFYHNLNPFDLNDAVFPYSRSREPPGKVPVRVWVHNKIPKLRASWRDMATTTGCSMLFYAVVGNCWRC